MELISAVPADDGGRPPVLFVHGAWHGAWCWQRHFLPHFAAQGYPAYALSLRGHGGTPLAGSLRGVRLRHYVEDVAEAAARIGTAPVVVGHSMGGLVVQHYLARHAAPAGVLLASVSPRGALGITLRVAAHHPLAFARANLTLRLYPLIADPGRSRRLLVSDRIAPDAWAALHARLGDESYLAYLDMVALDLPDPRRVRAPLLVLGAGQDAIVSTGEVRATARAYGTGPVILPDLSHDVMLDPGWRDAADRIIAWLGERLG